MMLESKIEFETVVEPDQNRLARALTLWAERAGEGRYRIAGGAQEHWVDLYTASHPQCDCGDYLWRDTICKHILAALLREGNEHVLRAVGALFASVRAKAA